MQKCKNGGIEVCGIILIMLPLLVNHITASTIVASSEKKSLQNTLLFAITPKQKLEALTNLMDFTHQQEQRTYAEHLYQEALKENNNYYKSEGDKNQTKKPCKC